ncbi:unnamed protein product [Moneuplotes crassus]|uniref:Uncharacterized protein n=1 Tax=Euplotes crassus TaxID=5936 RepID=A0AAD1XGL7_EUPCR|nr:unnamed protein product [Moneuplotes crassus]
MKAKKSTSFLPEEFKEKRKKHKKKKERHVKKIKAKKSRKKTKQIKHENNMLEKVLQNYRKNNYISKHFSEKVTGKDISLIKKILGKLIERSEKETMSQLPDLFEMLAEGSEIDIDGIADEYVKNKLNKIFKLMRFKRDDERTLVYRKNKKYHDFKLREFMLVLLRDAKEDLEKAEDESANQDSEANSEDSYKSGDSGDEEEAEKPAKPTPMFKDSAFDVNEGLIGPAIPEGFKLQTDEIEKEEADDYLDETLKMMKKDEEKDKGIVSVIEETIMGIFGDKKQLEDKRRAQKAKKLTIGAKVEELTTQQEALRQRKHTKFMDSYNQEHRPKSLLEEHEAKMRKRDKKKNRKDKDDAGFASKDTFKAMYGSNNMDSKFDTDNSRFL